MSYESYAGEDQSPKMVLEDLARTNRFTLAELEQNRKGILAETQRSRLIAHTLRPVLTKGSALAGWLFFLWLAYTVLPDIVIKVMFFTRFAGLIIPILATITGAAVLAVGIALFRAIRRMVLLTAEFNEGRCTSIEGRTSPSHELHTGLGLGRLYGEKYCEHWYVVQDQYFEVNEAAHAVLPPGRFRIYHTPRSKMLLSIEPR